MTVAAGRQAAPVSSRIGCSSWCRPANASSASDSTPALTKVREPSAVAPSRARCSSADFPIPGSPRTTERSAAIRESV
jgi:hypothetical protein